MTHDINVRLITQKQGLI